MIRASPIILLSTCVPPAELAQGSRDERDQGPAGAMTADYRDA